MTASSSAGARGDDPGPDVLQRVLRDLRADAGFDAATAFVRLACDYLADAHDGAGPVAADVPPAELAARLDEPLPRGGASLDALLQRLERDVLPGAIRLQHPRYAGHQVSPPLPAAAWTDALLGATNQSLAVREMSPVLTMLEHRVIRWMADLAGFGAAAGGTFTSGGTEATFSALLAARNHALPDAWETGVGTEAVLVCGEHAHYAVLRAAGELGLGARNAVLVPTRDWRMDPAALETTLGRLHGTGRRVVAVVATAGSTATGSFDDLEAIAACCERYGVWLHVDGAHGATALLSAAHRHRVAGMERAHTIAWDPHKMMLLPLPAGVLLAREVALLERAFAQRAPYLFHDAGTIALDQGTRSFQCSRRGDALKLWVALQRYGADGLGALYDGLCATTRACWEEVRARASFEALHEPESNILCFRWIGDGRQPVEGLDAINLAVRERWNRSGRGWITTTVLGGRRVLRVTVMNPITSREHVVAMLDGLEELAALVVQNEVAERQ